MIAKTAPSVRKRISFALLSIIVCGCDSQSTDEDQEEIAQQPVSLAAVNASSSNIERHPWFRTNVDLKKFLEENINSAELGSEDCNMSRIDLTSSTNLPNVFFANGKEITLRIESEDGDVRQNGAFRNGSFNSNGGQRCEFDAQFLENILLSKNESLLVMQFAGFSNGWATAHDTRTCQQYTVKGEAFDIASNGNFLALESACESVGETTGECNPASVYKLLETSCEPSHEKELSRKLTEGLFGVGFESTSLVSNPGSNEARILETVVQHEYDGEGSTAPISSQDIEVLAAEIEKVVENLDKAEFQPVRTKWAFDYGLKAGTGLLNTYEHLRSLTSFEAINRILPVKIFEKGPHTSSDLDLRNQHEFGHYNPDFVRLFHSATRYLLSDKAFIESTRPNVIKHGLIEKLQNMREVYAYIEDNKAQFQDFRDRYNRAVNERAWPAGGYRMVMPTALDTEHYWNWAETIYYFWIRRDLDGTKSMWISIINDILAAYEQSEKTE